MINFRQNGRFHSLFLHQYLKPVKQAQHLIIAEYETLNTNNQTRALNAG